MKPPIEEIVISPKKIVIVEHTKASKRGFFFIGNFCFRLVSRKRTKSSEPKVIVVFETKVFEMLEDVLGISKGEIAM